MLDQFDSILVTMGMAKKDFQGAVGFRHAVASFHYLFPCNGPVSFGFENYTFNTLVDASTGDLFPFIFRLREKKE